MFVQYSFALQGNPGLRNVHGILGSGIMTLFLIHAAVGLQLGLSYWHSFFLYNHLFLSLHSLRSSNNLSILSFANTKDGKERSIIVTKQLKQSKNWEFKWSKWKWKRLAKKRNNLFMHWFWIGLSQAMILACNHTQIAFKMVRAACKY